jgi:FkbM family methyltransferase
MMPIPNGVKERVWRALKLEWTLPTGIKVTQASRSDWYVFNEIFVNGLYDRAIHMAVSKAPTVRSFCFMDLGANVGFFSLRVSDLLRRQGGRSLRGLLVEGHPKTAADLKRRIHADNRLTELEVINGLVGKKSGSAYITDSDFSGNNTIFGKGEIEVPFVDLDRHSSEQIDLLKCDIEGAELEFVEQYAGLLSRSAVAVFELHSAICDVDRCRRVLAGYGFENSLLLHEENHLEVRQFWR